MARQSHIPERIISILMEDPTATRLEISKRLGVAYQSVQKHLLQLKDQGVILPSFQVAEKKIKKKHTFWIFILTQNPNMGKSLEMATDYQRELCNEIFKSFHDATLSQVVDAGMIFGGLDIVIGGRYDIILRIYSDNPDSVGRYVTRVLRGRPQIQSTSTAWSLRENSNSSFEIETAPGGSET